MDVNISLFDVSIRDIFLLLLKSNACPKIDWEIVKDQEEYGWADCAETRTLLVLCLANCAGTPHNSVECVIPV